MIWFISLGNSESSNKSKVFLYSVPYPALLFPSLNKTCSRFDLTDDLVHYDCDWTEQLSHQKNRVHTCHSPALRSAVLRIHYQIDPAIKQFIRNIRNPLNNKNSKISTSIEHWGWVSEVSWLPVITDPTWGWVCWWSPAWGGSLSRPGHWRSSPHRRRLWTEKTLTWVRWKSV